MKSEKESLIESRNSWAESAKADKKQLLASFILAATGFTLVGAGISSAFSGDVVGGTVQIGIGGGIAFGFSKIALTEIQDFADSTGITAVRQHQIDELKGQ